jgi:transcriptional regulator of met regulon
VTSTGDNASVNGVASAWLGKRLGKHRQTAVTDLQIGCAAHVTNLVVQAFLSGLGVQPDPDKEDLYEETQGEEIVYIPDQDPEVFDEAAIALEEVRLEQNGKLPAVDTEDLLQSESDCSDDSNSEGEDVAGNNRDTDDNKNMSDTEDSDKSSDIDVETASKTWKTSKKAKKLSAVDKVCLLHLSP